MHKRLAIAREPAREAEVTLLDDLANYLDVAMLWLESL
jgi:ABC-type phosphate transport system ATPase subunit